MSLRIYRIERTERIGWDEVDVFVVAAVSSREARRFAASKRENDYSGPGDEGSAPWLDPSRSTATLIGYALDKFVDPMLIVRSYNAG